MLFLIPLILFILPAVVLFNFSGEFFKTTKFINNMLKKEESQIGFMMAQANYNRLKLDHILESRTYDVWALGSSTSLQFRQQMFSSTF